MSDVTQVHVQRETLEFEVNIPGHEARVTTALFSHTRKLLIEREGGRCWVSGATAEESGHPLEAHHYPIERSLANMVDWKLFADDAKRGVWGPHAKAFDWDKFFEGAREEAVQIAADPESGEPARTVRVLVPVDPYLFVDDMTVNGLLLSKPFHTGKGLGIHDVPYPVWAILRYTREGYQFNRVLRVHHFDQGDGHA
ncbi:hypothetical protein [Burkholderia ubonensis]|uniref:Uncharacterized protein n=1 Tax=Burkholderia ubonensis TaxID=101571 RepID=A0ABD4E1C0_9BURK|nr:hypothetical protein [Burkholderia ubonensis]KVN83485.1 hypothetical protein WJ68_16370 [Burkholderia ubonensis]